MREVKPGQGGFAVRGGTSHGTVHLAPLSTVRLLRRDPAFKQILIITCFIIFGSTRIIDPAIGHVLRQVGADTGRVCPSLVTDVVYITTATDKLIGVVCYYVVPLLSLRRIAIRIL